MRIFVARRVPDAGLNLLFDAFGKENVVVFPEDRIISRDECLRIAPGLSPKGLTGAAIWYDGLFLNTERLTLAFVHSADQKGAVVANYTEVTSFLKANGFWPRSIKRLRLFVQSEVSPVNAGTWR